MSTLVVLQSKAPSAILVTEEEMCTSETGQYWKVPLLISFWESPRMTVLRALLFWNA